jgi:hypothetical protein
VVVIEQTTEQILSEFLDPGAASAPVDPAFIVDLQVNQEVGLQIDDLSEAPGSLVLEVNGIGLPVEIIAWESGVLEIRVPSVGISEATLGKLYVLNTESALVASVDARLHPAGG